jgi:hypothetical protein
MLAAFLIICVMAWLGLFLDGHLVSRRRENHEPWQRTPEQENELVHGIWPWSDDDA